MQYAHPFAYHTYSRAGLETLGLMHPHWYSASPDTQRKLISLFLLSLSPTSPTHTPGSTQTPFESELQYTRSHHDVAALLRWGLRHYQPSPDALNFGLQPDWYSTFSKEESGSGWSPKAFSDKLLPLLPKDHSDLLLALLDFTSSLASHSEANGISGSKFAKFVGLWLLSSSRSEESDDWARFYARWERDGRILEHLFLAKIR